MLNFTLKPGDYFMIGDDIKVVMAGGTANPQDNLQVTI